MNNIKKTCTPGIVSQPCGGPWACFVYARTGVCTIAIRILLFFSCIGSRYYNTFARVVFPTLINHRHHGRRNPYAGILYFKWTTQGTRGLELFRYSTDNVVGVAFFVFGANEQYIYIYIMNLRVIIGNANSYTPFNV